MKTTRVRFGFGYIWLLTCGLASAALSDDSAAVVYTGFQAHPENVDSTGSARPALLRGDLAGQINLVATPKLGGLTQFQQNLHR
ncbi:MAG: hypothetical protein H7A55_01205 [Verrucomicrobiaceae bacterium]|nr:hypothetical protein [Verrucomicrobiaceae bacterium]